MEVPYSLRKRPSALRTDAFLLFTDDPAKVLAAVSQLGGDWPEIYAIHDGYLFVPMEVNNSLSGAIRLRRLAGSLFVPVDADLWPTLLAEEIIDLTRQRGLVVLPDAVFLAFDVNAPVAVSQFLASPNVVRSDAKAFPDMPQLAEHLTEIRVESSQPMAEILLAGQPDSASPLSRNPADKVPDAARPPGGSLLENLQARLKLGMGQTMNFLGRNLNLPGMANLGSSLARSALEAVPRLTEKILGQQEGALREVLRQLERGNIEDALRRAPPAFADPDAPLGRVDTGSSLGFRNTNYSLGQLLGTGGSAGSVWLGGGDVWALLAAQYRKLGEDAMARGDFRRAAYIYGVLLRDLRQAAQVLSQGALHRDAAILYQDKLKDPINAAREFEKAGLYDDALRHYLALEHFETAGDIYRKLGDEAEAETLYHREAGRLADAKRHRAAGDLVTAKTGHFALAQSYFQAGWDCSGTEQLACAERLLETHASHKRWDDVQVLVEEAELRFAPPNVEEASRFYETLFRHEAAMPEDVKADLRDQARLALAEHLQHYAESHAAPGNIIAKAFGSRGHWSASTVRDAAVALKGELRR
jgi:MoxR-vWA-beta-propeller ternary system domain bpX3